MPADSASAVPDPAPVPLSQSHVRFIVGAVTILAVICVLCGSWLLWKGFAGGELLVAQVGTAIGGLLTMLSQSRSQQGQAATLLTTAPPAPAQPPPVVVAPPLVVTEPPVPVT